MNAELLAGAAGVLLTLAFSYVPGLSAKFAEQAPEIKRLVMLGLLALVAGAAFGLACAGDPFGFGIVCDQAGAIGLVRAFAAAAIANQTAYALSPQTSKVKAAKERRGRGKADPGYG